MVTPLLRTKLYIPKPYVSNLVPRPGLLERLNEGLGQNPGIGRKLTLISAPAGFGKTTLVSEWLQRTDWSAAWLSLDEEDNDPTRFLAYFIAALQQIEAEIGQSAQNLLQSPLPAPPEILMTTLVNDLTTYSNNIILVLDDYHLINAQPVHQMLTFLLEHLPPQMHLTITTRADPPLPLARLRVRRHLTELRENDLRFTVKQATAFLNQVMGLNLTATHIALLERRTEGWIAGLQLAALSIQRQEGREQFINAFAGDDQYIVDYLIDEVFSQQSDKTKDFLLQTSILNRMSGPLCDAVTGNEDSQVSLEALQQANLFLFALDTRRHWYRYHHLFADLLRHRLLQTDSQLARQLHLRAAYWYLGHGYLDDAVHHAIESQDAPGIEGVFIEVTKESINQVQHLQALRWYNRLPEKIRTNRYRLLLFEGYLHLFLAQTTQLRSIVAQVQTLMPTNAPAESQSLLAGLQGFLADEADQPATAIALYETALAGLAPVDEVIQNALRTLLGLARLRTGHLEKGFELIVTIFQQRHSPQHPHSLSRHCRTFCKPGCGNVDL